MSRSSPLDRFHRAQLGLGVLAGLTIVSSACRATLATQRRGVSR